MSLLDEWADVEQRVAGSPRAWETSAGGGSGDGTGGPVSDAAYGDAPDGDDDGAGEGRTGVPLLSVETLERRASHGQGDITAVAAAANCVLLGTATGALIRYDFAEGAATGTDLKALCVPPTHCLHTVSHLSAFWSHRGGAHQAG